MLKTLATCKPSEFLVQTNRVRIVAEKWLKNTNILNIRKNQPEYPDGATEEEKQAILEAQVRKNLSQMFDAILDTCSGETLELMALLCFVEPENVDDHDMGEYIEAITGLITNKAVLRFFTSLVQLGQKNTSGV